MGKMQQKLMENAKEAMQEGGISDKSVAEFAASICQSKGAVMQALLPAGADQLFLPCFVQEEIYSF
jgi:alpha-D-ribose 1-methylphosphonate 5-triphosphate synthase subunit PhnI